MIIVKIIGIPFLWRFLKLFHVWISACLEIVHWAALSSSCFVIAFLFFSLQVCGSTGSRGFSVLPSVYFFCICTSGVFLFILLPFPKRKKLMLWKWWMTMMVKTAIPWHQTLPSELEQATASRFSFPNSTVHSLFQSFWELKLGDHNWWSPSQPTYTLSVVLYSRYCKHILNCWIFNPGTANKSANFACTARFWSNGCFISGTIFHLVYMLSVMKWFYTYNCFLCLWWLTAFFDHLFWYSFHKPW